MSYIKTVAYKDDATYFVDELKIGMLRSAKEIAVTPPLEVKAFGETEPVCLANGTASYEIVLKREQSGDIIDFARLGEFTLNVETEHGGVVYGSCRCRKIETERNVGQPMLEVITITAKSRKEV